MLTRLPGFARILILVSNYHTLKYIMNNTTNIIYVFYNNTLKIKKNTYHKK